MKLLPSRKMLHASLAVTVVGIAVVLTSTAQAFTFENPNATVGDTNALRFGTGDSRFSTNNGNGTSSGPASRPGSFSSGNGSLQFGGQSSFNQRYNAERMFDSNGILGKDR
jgi:uncharacterized membrane protein YgcG